jgi:hypothetical protein
LRYAHRQAEELDLYFVANPSDERVSTNARFRVTGRQPELWDPLTGGRRDLADFAMKGAVTEVPLQFEPRQSFFVVFHRSAPAPSKSATNFASTHLLGELPGPWEVAFDPKWGGPERVLFAALEDWTKRPEDGIRHYSGIATYRTKFDRQAFAVASGTRVLLDLGTVKNLARVRLNGQDLGVVWCAPWRVDVTRALRDKDNHLEIAVANLWPNRLIRDSGLPVEQRLTWTTWNPFKPDSALLPSGLLGPVTLRRETSGRPSPPAER